MIRKLDSLAVPAKHDMCAKIRVELYSPSPSHEKGSQIQFQLLHVGKWQVWPNGQGVVPFFVIRTRKHAGSVLVYHLPVPTKRHCEALKPSRDLVFKNLPAVESMFDFRRENVRGGDVVLNVFLPQIICIQPFVWQTLPIKIA